MDSHPFDWSNSDPLDLDPANSPRGAGLTGSTRFFCQKPSSVRDTCINSRNKSDDAEIVAISHGILKFQIQSRAAFDWTLVDPKDPLNRSGSGSNPSNMPFIDSPVTIHYWNFTHILSIW